MDGKSAEKYGNQKAMHTETCPRARQQARSNLVSSTPLAPLLSPSQRHRYHPGTFGYPCFWLWLPVGWGPLEEDTLRRWGSCIHKLGSQLENNWFTNKGQWDQGSMAEPGEVFGDRWVKRTLFYMRFKHWYWLRRLREAEKKKGWMKIFSNSRVTHGFFNLAYSL